MAAVLSPYRGPFCSELPRLFKNDEIADCVAASGIDIANAATLGAIPTHAAEREALRADSGDEDGPMTLESLRKGLSARYGLDATFFVGMNAIHKALKDGVALVVLGQYSVLPRKRRFQTRADFLHAMFFNTRDGQSVFRADPLAGPAHKGGRMPNDLFEKYAESGGFKALGLQEATAQGKGGPNMGQTTLTLTPFDPPFEIRYKVNTPRFTATGRATPTAIESVAMVDARAFIEQSDNRVPHGHRFFRLATGGSTGFFMFEDHVTRTGAVGPSGNDCAAETAELQKTIERLQSQIDDLMADEENHEPPADGGAAIPL